MPCGSRTARAIRACHLPVPERPRHATRRVAAVIALLMRFLRRERHAGRLGCHSAEAEAANRRRPIWNAGIHSLPGSSPTKPVNPSPATRVRLKSASPAGRTDPGSRTELLPLSRGVVSASRRSAADELCCSQLAAYPSAAGLLTQADLCAWSLKNAAVYRSERSDWFHRRQPAPGGSVSTVIRRDAVTEYSASGPESLAATPASMPNAGREIVYP